MAIVDGHLRFFWGLLDISIEGASPSYPYPTSYATLGSSAAAGVGVGVRRATLVLNRTSATPADDDALMHFDFLNITGGAPDDTWTSGDYSSLEVRLATFFTAVAALVPNYYHFSRVYWHRVGPDVVLPNPAERIVDLASPIAGTDGLAGPPQLACAITFRTGVRHSWGRTYLPIGSVWGATGRLTSPNADTICNAAHALLSGAMGDDFHPVVVSKPLRSALGIDTVETDDVVDIIRRRRWKHTLYRKLETLP